MSIWRSRPASPAWYLFPPKYKTLPSPKFCKLISGFQFPSFRCRIPPYLPTGAQNIDQLTLHQTKIQTLALHPCTHMENPTSLFFFNFPTALMRTTGGQYTKAQSYRDVSGKTFLEIRYGAPTLLSSSRMKVDLEKIPILLDKGSCNYVVVALVRQARTMHPPPLVPEPIPVLPMS